MSNTDNVKSIQTLLSQIVKRVQITQGFLHMKTDILKLLRFLFVCDGCLCFSPGSCRFEGRRGSTWCCRTCCKSHFIKLLFIPSPALCPGSMLYRMLGYMKHEVVSMVISDRDHHIKRKSESCDMLTSTLYLLLFPGCHWGEGPRWDGWCYWPARKVWWRGFCWADGRERRASKIWNIAHFCFLGNNVHEYILYHHLPPLGNKQHVLFFWNVSL